MADVDGLIFNELIDQTRVSGPGTWRYKVLMAVVDAGATGATDHEISDLLQAPGGPSNLRPRRIELVDAGYLVDSGSKRRTSSGSQATVWKLSSQDRATLTPAFTLDDCQLAGGLAGASLASETLPQIDRRAGEQLRARFGLLGRRMRRAAAEVGTAVDVEVERPGPIELHVWRTASDQSRFEFYVNLDEDGLDLVVLIGSADSSDEAADAREQRYRSELARLTTDDLMPINRLIEQGWVLSTSKERQASFETPQLWLQALADDPTASGSIARQIPAADLVEMGASVADVLTQLVREILPIDEAAESAMQDPVQALVNGLLWDEARARDLLALVRRSRQLLFAGPPGTGKTLAARILAAALADETRIRLVQFHPTYAYEDFVEGIRPVLDDPSTAGDEQATTAATNETSASSGLRYRIRPGVFKQLVLDAQLATAEAPHFLIIDEINRANLPRVLGELLFALEYRGPDNEVELAYSAEKFYVPDNLWVIGTMNTADRSVALLDAAMRRRFKEVRFDVDYTVLRRWHERNTSAELGTEAAQRLHRLNAEVIALLDDDRAIGHSFLIRQDLAEVGFEVVWREDLEPVLRDHLLGRIDDLPALREAFLEPA